MLTTIGTTWRGPKRVAVLVLVALLLALGAATTAGAPPPAAAFATSNVDLIASGRLPHLQQGDARWGSYTIGPEDTSEIDIEGCGCWLTLLAAHLDGLLGFPSGAVPRFPHLVRTGVISSRYDDKGSFEPIGYLTSPVLEFTPRYVDLYVKGDPDSGIGGRGYPPIVDFRRCGTATLPNALEAAAVPALDPVTQRPITGAGVAYRSFTGFGGQQQMIALSRVGAGRSTVLRMEFPKEEGGVRSHVITVAGWDAVKQQFLVYDPAQPDIGRARTVEEAFAITYDEFLSAAKETRFIEPVSADGKWFGVIDDPEPIEFVLIDPLGRRTGYRTDESSYNEAPFDGYVRSDALSDPAGQTPEDVARKMVYQRDPVDGVYGLEVIGTGDGEYAFSTWTATGGQNTFGERISGSITTGKRVRYEITLANGAVTDVRKVDQFTPRAVIGSATVAATGAPVAFTGHQSSSVDAAITAWDWDFGDGATAAGRDVQHAFGAPGAYPVRLTVTDTRRATAASTRTVRVFAPPPPGRTTSMVTRSFAEPGFDGGGQTLSFAVTPDGRYVVAGTSGSGFDTPREDSSGFDIYRFDLTTGAAVLVRPTNGTVGLSGTAIDLSHDGRFVTFLSLEQLDARDTDTDNDLYLADLADPDDITFELLGIAPDGQPFTGQSVAQRQTRGGQLSADGRYVLVQWENPKRSAAGCYGFPQVCDYGVIETHLRDRLTGTTTLLSARTTASTVVVNDDDAVPQSISADGRFVVMASKATNLSTATPVGGAPAVLVLDRDTGAFDVADRYDTTNDTDPWAYPTSNNVYPADISADGRYVLFLSNSQSFLAPSDQVSSQYVLPEAYVRDRTARTTRHVGNGSRPVSLTTGTSSLFLKMGTYTAAMTEDGSAVAFVSRRDDLVPNDTNLTGTLYEGDAFLWYRDTGLVTRESLTVDDAQADRGARLDLGVDVDDDASVLFLSDSSNLTREQVQKVPQLYRRGPVASGGSNGRPVADLGGPYLGFATTDEQAAAVDLDASRSVDPERAPLTATLTTGAGATLTTAASVPAAATYDRPGTYTASLAVSDGNSTSTLTSARVDVLDPPAPDSIAFDTTCVAPGATVGLGGVARSANASLVASGWDVARGPVPLADVSVHLDWTDDVTAATTLPALTYSTAVTLPTDPGTYTARLGTGGPEATIAVPCPPPPDPVPVAVAGGPYQVVAGQPLRLDGTGSRDPLGGDLTYEWSLTDFDVKSTSGATPVVTLAEGTYTAVLEVRSGERVSDRSVRAPQARATITVLSAAVPPSSPPPPSAPGSPAVPTRLGGVDRYDTAARVSRWLYPDGATDVFLAAGSAYPDALVAAPLAAQRGGPVLLVADPLPEATRAELARLRPARVTVLGGPARVPDSVVAAVRAVTGGEVTRLGGADRYETAALIAARLAPTGLTLVASGDDFPDALGASGGAASGGHAVLLTRRSALPEATRRALAGRPGSVLVVGGGTVVDESVVVALRNSGLEVERLGGADRFETSALLARRLGGPGPVFAASGGDFADALVAAPGVGRRQGRLLLVRSSCVPPAVAGALQGAPATVVVGGPSAVSDAALTTACSA